MNRSLTKRQKDIYDYIRREIKSTGYPPSVREICKAVGLSSSSTVHAHLRTLQDKGMLKVDPSKRRAIRLVDRHLHSVITMPENEPQKTIPLPLIGRVAAGQPLFAEQNIDRYIDMPSEMVRGKEVFALEVKGDSMQDAGILPGDVILVSSQQTANNGEIIVALLEDEVTVKRFYKEKEYVVLKPENKQYAPIISRHVQVLGKVIGLLRTY